MRVVIVLGAEVKSSTFTFESHTHDFGSIDKCVEIECATSIDALSLLSRYQREATKWGDYGAGLTALAEQYK